MNRRLWFLGVALLLTSACGGHTATDAPMPVPPDGAAPADDSGPRPLADAGDAGDSATVTLPDAAPALDAGPQLVACEGCLALHCATYGTCERDPRCLQALATYIDCTRRDAPSACTVGLENDPAVPGDITLCLAASCETDCSSH